MHKARDDSIFHRFLLDKWFKRKTQSQYKMSLNLITLNNHFLKILVYSMIGTLPCLPELQNIFGNFSHAICTIFMRVRLHKD